MLLRSIRQWVYDAVFLLGIELLTLAHTVYVQNMTLLPFWPSLIFSNAGLIGGVVTAIGGAQILRCLSTPASEELSTEQAIRHQRGPKQ